ncbi:uncharacterized protein [Rhodnius prolixus]|uniref:Uncharacterized protein n=1 Tax=Rhodnius prolixus TaxID=13249 RepID=T1IGM4_RHOPR
MEKTNILDEIDFDEWIYAGYVTTYREHYKWLQREGAQPTQLQKKTPPLLEKPKPTHLCDCRRKVPKIEEVEEDEDYLKGFRTTYGEAFLPVTVPEIGKRIELPIESKKELRETPIKLTEEEERIILRDYLARQKIKIKRKRPKMNSYDISDVIFD